MVTSPAPLETFKASTELGICTRRVGVPRNGDRDRDRDQALGLGLELELMWVDVDVDVSLG